MSRKTDAILKQQRAHGLGAAVRGSADIEVLIEGEAEPEASRAGVMPQRSGDHGVPRLTARIA